ncbi:MAG: polysaccharide deacetylase family protein [Azonexus sp.]|uniref:polysaccharide deacetylase family protein n=1 Tax=Hydrogenophaga sp. TaxID=1904254 RepID=UPI00271B6DB2|nr:polysaccharide deacetylase family protein [Hydrogenophaga sp.]MDZ4058214.1 polysaccharide deacetylase family protein [Polynucleobacter sp.]MDZ4316263.1 polysaccharide deacetylase family protein [Azonexus sp.]MDO9480548.1 polysaccharide deacetylase family protein [Hydrogenophaga sp.]MDO9604732.1 polysaccharide deacetylase family protein [Hydrogenophaga sp.]MDP3376489.1 polysaccharide deacetylase family protein [Hydrogenophaga sp.]
MNPLDDEVGAWSSIFRRIGTYIPLMIILGLSIPAIIYLTIMQSLGWSSPVLTARGFVVGNAPVGESLILYAAPSTKAHFTDAGGNYETLLVPWRNYFFNRKLDYEEFDDIKKLRKKKEGVVILPSAVSLSEEERVELQAFRSRGGGILATWATGTRSSNRDWEGWQFLERMGVKYVGDIDPSKEINYLILNGEMPVSFSHPAGQRLLMGQTSEPLLRVTGDMTAGLFMNWARITDDERKGEGAVVFSEDDDELGRAAFFAFAETAWESRPLAAYTLIDDTLSWLQRRPAMVRASWPNGKLAAQVIEMDTEQGFENALLFADMMSALNYPATFYVLTSVAKLFPEVLFRLSRDFEIGFHGEVHNSFKGQTPSLQEQRIQSMRAELAQVMPGLQGITGFRAPTEGYDATTELLIHKFGMRHHAADPNRTESRLPLLAKIDGVKPDDALIVLPRTQRDDINLYWEKLSVEETTKALIDDFEMAFRSGSLAWLSIHSQNFNADGVLIKALPGFLDYLKTHSDRLWLATAGDVADWWRERERLKVSSSFNGKRLEFDVTVTGSKPLKGASLIVMLPKKAQVPSVQSVKVGMIRPTITMIDDYRASIVFDELQPGNYAYQVTFSN